MTNVVPIQSSKKYQSKLDYSEMLPAEACDVDITDVLLLMIENLIKSGSRSEDVSETLLDNVLLYIDAETARKGIRLIELLEFSGTQVTPTLYLQFLVESAVTLPVRANPCT